MDSIKHNYEMNALIADVSLKLLQSGIASDKIDDTAKAVIFSCFTAIARSQATDARCRVIKIEEGSPLFEILADILDHQYLELDEAGYDLAELSHFELSKDGLTAHFDINTMSPLVLI